jgi:phosphatidylserine/phosphatidylglycerophosphate/cardiolipin synthase-like enzyme
MDKVEFPVITSPASKRDDFLACFQNIVSSEFEHIIAVAPYVDGKFIENLLRFFLFNQRKLQIVSRFGDLYKEHKKQVKRAVEKLKDAAEKDPTMEERIIWYVNPHLHAKFVVKDWECILFGSQNFTYSALKKNYELGAFIKDISPFREDLESFLKDIFDNSTKILFPANSLASKRKGGRKKRGGR